MKKSILPIIAIAIALGSLETAFARGIFDLGGSRTANLDTDGDGIVSKEEHAAARAARAATRQAIIDEADADGDGVLNTEERAVVQEVRSAMRAAAKEQRFTEVDNGDGELTLAELQAALPDMNEERLAAGLIRIDTDGSGTLSLAEFISAERRDRNRQGRRFKSHRGGMGKPDGRRGNGHRRGGHRRNR